MKQIQFLVFIVLVGATSAMAEGRPESLPFDVKLGGQMAVPISHYAQIPNPISADAELEAVVPANDTVFINIFISDANGIVKTENSSAKEIILINGGAKVKINQTVSKNVLPPGIYLANIMAQSSGQTARIVFTVK